MGDRGEVPVVTKPSGQTVVSSPKRMLTDVSLSFEEIDHLQTTLAVIQSRRYVTFDRKPWLDEEGNQIWSDVRIRVAKVVLSQLFETCMGLIIIFNLGIIIYEADQDAMCYPEFKDNYFACKTRAEAIPWVKEINIALLVVYSVECCLRAFAERGRFLCNAWNIMDVITVILGWTSMAVLMLNLSLLRLSRLVRVLRAARVFISVPEFYLLLTGLFSSIKAIVFGSVILVSVIGFWAVICVEILHPEVSGLDCERCPKGFRSVGDASVTLFQQIVAGDSWGAISIPLLENQPWHGPLLFIIMISISLGVMNLILAVIVERATEARENDHERKLKRKDLERNKNMVDFAVLCHDMDVDESGSLSLHEMLRGYDDNDSFRKLMDIMDIKRSDMETIFRVLDEDCSGEVSYIEFCQHLASFWERDPIMLQSLVKYSIMEIRKVIGREIMHTLHEHSRMLQEQSRLLHEHFGQPEPEAPVPEEWKPPDLQSFSSLHEELEPLLAKASLLVLDALPRPDQVARWKQFEECSEGTVCGGNEGNEGHEQNAHGVVPSSLSAKIDQQFTAVCEAFEKRIQEAADFQHQCREMVVQLQALKIDASSGKTPCLLTVPV